MVAHTLLHAILLPALVAAAVALPLAAAPRLRAGAAGAVGFAAAYVMAHRGLVGWHGLLPVDVTHRLPSMALLAGALGFLAAIPQLGPNGRLGPAAAAPVASWALLAPMESRFSAGAWIGVWVVGTVALVAHSWAWTKAARQIHPVPFGVAFVVAALSLGAASAASGSLVLGQLTAAVAAAVGALAATAWIVRRHFTLEPTAATAGILLGSMALLAGVYSTTLPGALVLWAMMPLGILTLHAVAAGRLRPAVIGAAQLALAVAWGGAAAAWAATAHAPADPAGDYDYGYGDT